MVGIMQTAETANETLCPLVGMDMIRRNDQTVISTRCPIIDTVSGAHQ